MDIQDSDATAAEIDLTCAPLGVGAAMALVQAVAASDDRVERHFLEIKSDLDLSQKKDIAWCPSRVVVLAPTCLTTMLEALAPRRDVQA